MVGTGRFELPACRLGGGRSIQLSYVPAGDGRLHFNNLPAAEAFGADVAAVVHAVEMDGGEGGVGVGDGGGEIGAGGGDSQNAAAGGFEAVWNEAGAGVEDGGGRGCDSANSVAGARRGGVAVSGQDDADGGFGIPGERGSAEGALGAGE